VTSLKLVERISFEKRQEKETSKNAAKKKTKFFLAAAWRSGHRI
jgi:hypothetical protein